MSRRRPLLVAGSGGIDPTAHWKFEDDFLDELSINPFTTTANTSFIDGPSDRAVKFADAAGYAYLTPNANILTTEATVDMMVRRTSLGATQFPLCFSSGANPSPDEIQLFFRADTGGAIDNTFEISLVNDGAGVFLGRTAADACNTTGWARFRVFATGTDYIVMKDDDVIPFSTITDAGGWRGKWAGDLPKIDTMTLAGVTRGTVVLPGGLEVEDLKIYDSVV